METSTSLIMTFINQDNSRVSLTKIILEYL